MLSFGKLFNRIRPGKSALAQHLAASSKPVGALVAAGINLEKLVATEKRTSVLEAFIKRAESTNDQKWMLAAGRRLMALGASDETILGYARNLLWANHIDQASAAFEAVSKSKTEPALFVQTAFLLDLARNRFDAASANLTELSALAPNMGLEGIVKQVERLIEVGKYDQAKELVERAMVEHPDYPGLAAAHIKVSMVFDGPEAALNTLQDHAELLGPKSEVFRNIHAGLLLERGRFNEAFDLLQTWIIDNPKFYSLYPLADMAASHCDRKDEFGALLVDIRKKYPKSPELIELQCNWFIDQNEWSGAEAHLQSIRIRSSWSGKIMDLAAACQKPDTDPDVSQVNKAHDILLRDGVGFSGPNIMLAFYIYYFKAGNGGIDKAMDLILPLLPDRMGDSEFLALYLRLLIAQGHDEMCRKFYFSLPKGLTRTVALAPFLMYFSAMQGEHEAASLGWEKHLESTAHMSLNARSSYPAEIKLRYTEAPDDVLLFLTIYNGIEFIDWFLDYYRDLGVDHFFVTDNGSDDGTFEHLLKQKDVSVFQNTGSFSASACGVFWSNHLMRRFGVGHWCFHVDMDEAFVFPGMENGRSLRDLLAYMDSQDFGTIPSLMLDIYPENLEISEGEDPISRSEYIDSDYFSMRNELPPYTFIQGGLRSRLSGRSLLMTKAPLVKMTRDLAYIANNHQHSHRPVADISSALLHYKFIGDFIGRIDEAIERKEHFMGARFYKSVRNALDDNDTEASLLSEYSVKYQGPEQLQNMGLIKSSTAWEKFTSNFSKNSVAKTSGRVRKK